MKRDVLGLHIIALGDRASPALRRMRAQLQAADALVTIERDEAEPADIAIARREGEELLKQARYEDAQDALLAAIDRGLELGYFSWHAR